MSTPLLTWSLFSFGTPCLKWKLAAAFKTHWGFTGYDATISPPNRYLTKTVVYTVTDTFAGQSSTSVVTSVINVDHMSGAVTGSAPDGEGPIGGGAPVIFTGDTVQTTDTGVIVTGSNATRRQIWQVTLSNQYSLTTLERDVDALLAGFDPASVANQTITSLVYPADPNPTAGEFATLFAPAPYNYPQVLVGNPAAPTLGALAITGYALAGQFVQSFFTAGMGKVEGWFAMAGEYALVNYILNSVTGQPIGRPTCVAGRGGCSTWVNIGPLQYVPGQATYTVLNPNTTCALLGL